MSRTIDERVVEMRFDNKQFEQNVSTTMSTLDKLKQRLNLSGASKGLEEVNAASKRCDMSILSGAVETVRSRFSALEVMGVTALANITNSAVNAGKRIASALTIDPIKSGFSEYETQINAVQTILANTESKGKTLDDVNGALDELNTYADKTIYNFTEMTRNIGTFTAAGVDLDTSVSAIKGIANLAAVSGSTSQQASTAMYQLSQALASGTVKLMDWNSVVNAGMGGQVFQDALKETARVSGVAIDDLIAKEGSFRETLKHGWLTSDILTKTLAKFTGDLTEEQLKAMGYTDEQIKGIIKMGKTANDAATKVKTFSQLFDTLKEAAQSGWTQTWEIIVGDFEEAKEFLTEVSNTLGEIIGSSAETRNELLENWKVLGGRTDVIESIRNVFEGVMGVIKPIKEAFREIFPPMTAERLVAITSAFKEFTAKLKLSETNSENLKRTFKGLFAVVDIFRQLFVAAFKAVKSLFGGIGELGNGVLETTAGFGDWLVALSQSIKSGDTFGKIFRGVVDIVKSVIQTVSSFIKLIKNGFVAPGFEAFKNLLGRMQGGMSTVGKAATSMKDLLIAVFDKISSALESCTLLKILEGMWKIVTSIGSGIAKVFGGLINGVTNAFNSTGFDGIMSLINGLVTGGLTFGLIKLFKGFTEPLENIQGIVGKLTGVLDGVRDSLKSFQDMLKAETLKKIAVAVAILAASLVVLAFIDTDKLFNAMTIITALFLELMTTMSVMSKLNPGPSIVKISTAMKQLATALLILSVAMKILSTISLKEMGVSLLGIAGGLGLLLIAVNLLPDKKVESASKAIKKLSTALLIMSVALKIMSTMSWQEMSVGLVATVVALGALVAAANLLPKDMATRSLGITSMAMAMLILSGALKIMATMSWGEVAIGLVTLAGAMAILVVSANLMQKALPGALAMSIIAPAIVALSVALKILSSMQPDGVIKSLIALGGAMAILAVGLNFMKSAIPGALALIVAATAIGVLTPALLLLGTMSWESIIKGLVSIAGAFTIVGVAATLLQPLLPAIIGLGAAMALIGVGVLAAGLGLMAFGAGLSAIAVGFTALIASLGAATAGVVTIVRAIVVGIITGIGDGIKALGELIAGSTTSLGKAIKTVVLTLCAVLVECVPAISDAVLKILVGVLDSIAKYTPLIVGALFDFVIGILNGIAEHIPELIKAVANIFMSIFTGAIDSLKDMDAGSLIKGLASIGLMAGIVVALAAIVPFIPAAMSGAVGLGIVIAELAVVLAAVGALAQIPGLEWLIGEGGNLLQKIGNAIGKFVGGLASGVAEGFTDSLPEVGNDLSSFMSNLQPFIIGARMLDDTVLQGVKNLVNMMLTITGANLLESITSWVTGESSIVSFSEDLVTFGKGIKGFSDAVAGISPENVVAAADAAKKLAEMTTVIPKEGGIKAWFTGENGMTKFADKLPTLGGGLKAFSESVSGISPENITAAATAAKTLAEMVNTVPKKTDTIIDFGKNITTFGGKLKSYFTTTSSITAESIESSKQAIDSVKDVTSLNSDNIKKVSSSIKDIATSIKDLAKVPKNSTSNFTKALKELGKVSVESLVNTFKDAKSDMEKAGKELINSLIKGINSKTDSAEKACKNLAKACSEVINDRESDFVSVGKNLVKGFTNGINANSYQPIDKVRAMAIAAANAARAALVINSPSKVFKEIGSSIPEGFALGIRRITDVSNAVSFMGDTAVSSVKNTISHIADVINSDINTQPTIRPVLDLSDVKSGVRNIGGMLNFGTSVDLMSNVGAINSMMTKRYQNRENADIVSAIDKLYDKLDNVGGTTNIIDGIKYNDGTDVADAIKTLIKAAKIERRK